MLLKKFRSEAADAGAAEFDQIQRVITAADQLLETADKDPTNVPFKGVQQAVWTVWGVMHVYYHSQKTTTPTGQTY